eukprot:IDg7853t1
MQRYCCRSRRGLNGRGRIRALLGWLSPQTRRHILAAKLHGRLQERISDPEAETSAEERWLAGQDLNTLRNLFTEAQMSDPVKAQ